MKLYVEQELTEYYQDMQRAGRVIQWLATIQMSWIPRMIAYNIAMECRRNKFTNPYRVLEVHPIEPRFFSALHSDNFYRNIRTPLESRLTRELR